MTRTVWLALCVTRKQVFKITEKEDLQIGPWGMRQHFRYWESSFQLKEVNAKVVVQVSHWQWKLFAWGVDTMLILQLCTTFVRREFTSSMQKSISWFEAQQSSRTWKQCSRTGCVQMELLVSSYGVYFAGISSGYWKKKCSISTDTQCAVLLVSVVSECFSTWCVNIKHRLISGRITRGTVCNEYLITDLCSVL